MRGSVPRAALLFVLAAAFLLQTFSWAARVPARPAAAAVEICTAHGLTVVMLDADGVPINPPTAPATPHDCPLCPLIAGLSVAPAWDGVPPPSSVAALPSAPAPTQQSTPVGSASDVWARGPPVAAA